MSRRTPAPKDAAHWRQLSTQLYAAGRRAEAEAAYRQVIALAPGDADAWTNLGAVLRHRGALEEAQAALAHALVLRPRHPRANANTAAILSDLGHDTEAIQLLRQVLEDLPGDAAARTHLGMMLLRQGRYAEGFPLFEARYLPRLNEPMAYASPPLPRWNGEPLEGKSFALWFEQGMGDALQMLRYVPLLRQRGLRRLTLVGPPALRPLLAGVPGVDAVVVPGEQMGWHDHWALMMSLPLHFGTTLETIPAALPYLRAEPARVAHWAPKLPRGLRVGVAWKGSHLHANDRYRSLPGLRTLRPLWDVPGLAWISLQKGQAEDEAAAAPGDQPLVPLGSEIGDFADLAAVVAQLDLVICVDTAVAHLAGALGKRVWVLLPAFATDWRWLHGRTDSPWYPGVMRLFRQRERGDWDAVVGEVRQALLRQLLAAQPRNAQARTLLAALSPPVSRAALRRGIRP
ncbi:MAG: tetratricopeptide repeat protein [Ramlibacter sp.]